MGLVDPAEVQCRVAVHGKVDPKRLRGRWNGRQATLTGSHWQPIRTRERGDNTSPARSPDEPTEIDISYEAADLILLEALARSGDQRAIDFLAFANATEDDEELLSEEE